MRVGAAGEGCDNLSPPCEESQVAIVCKLDTINREHRGDQDELDNENKKNRDVESKLKNKGHEQEGKKRLNKLNDHINASQRNAARRAEEASG